MAEHRTFLLDIADLRCKACNNIVSFSEHEPIHVSHNPSTHSGNLPISYYDDRFERQAVRKRTLFKVGVMYSTKLI